MTKIALISHNGDTGKPVPAHTLAIETAGDRVDLALDMYSQPINGGIGPDKTVPVLSRLSTPAKTVRTMEYIQGSLPKKYTFQMTPTDVFSFTETSCLMSGRKAVAVVGGIAGYMA